MPKRTLIFMTLAAALTLAVYPAMAMNVQGNSTRRTSTATHGVAAADKTRTLASVRTHRRSGLRAWRYWHRKLRAYESETWYRERVMEQSLTRTSRRLAWAGLASLIPYARRWKQISRRKLYEFRHPPLLSDWLCIHHYEGAWNDSGAPYWGGLQMDLSFQQTYGPMLFRTKGTADHWTPMEQIWVAERAYKSRGFSPWPNTARDCGLLN